LEGLEGKLVCAIPASTNFLFVDILKTVEAQKVLFDIVAYFTFAEVHPASGGQDDMAMQAG
jgi:hypothetical protein